MQSSYTCLPAGGDASYTCLPAGAMLAPTRLTNAGSCPSRQRDCVATAARSAETKGTAQLPCGSGETQGDASPPLPSPPPPLRGLRERFAHPYYLRNIKRNPIIAARIKQNQVRIIS